LYRREEARSQPRQAFPITLALLLRLVIVIRNRLRRSAMSTIRSRE
jgi:hypothetical protein